MNETRLKLQSVVLTLIMVTSIFAVAPGAVSADSHVDPGDVSFNTYDANDIDVTDGTATHNLQFDLGVEADQEYEVTVDARNLDGLGIDVGNITDGGTGTTGTASEYTVTDNDDGTATVTVNTTGEGDSVLTIPVDVELSTADASTGSVSYSVTSTAGSGDSVAFTAYSSDRVRYDSDEHYVIGDDRFWTGQMLFYKADPVNFDNANTLSDLDGETVDLYYGTPGGEESPEFKGEVALDENGEALIDTANRDSGAYFIGQTDSSSLVQFDVAEQTFSASANTVVTDTNGQISVDFDSTRGAYDVIVTADGISDSDLEQLIQAPTSGDDQIVVNTRDLDNGQLTLSNFQAAKEFDLSFEVADTRLTDSLELTVNEAGTESAALQTSLFTEHQGDIAEVTVDLSNTDQAYVVIGDESNVGYEVAGTVTDSDEEGSATLLVNTYDGSVFAADGATWNQDYHNGISNSVLDTGEYPLEVQVVGTDTPDSIGTLSLQDRSTDAASTLVAPQGASFSSAEDIQDAFDAGTLNAVDSIAIGDTVVVEVEATGIHGLVQAQEDVLGNESALSVSIQSDTGLNQDPVEISADDVEVVSDRADDTLYLVFQADDSLTFTRNGEEIDHSLANGDAYEVEFVVDDEMLTDGDAETTATTFSLADRANFINANAEGIAEVEVSESAVVEGTSTLAPGSTITVQIQSGTDIPNPFVDHSEATVQTDGTWTAEFDLSEVPEDTEFGITVLNPETSAEGLTVEGIQDDDSSDDGSDDTGSDDSSGDDSSSDTGGSDDTGSDDSSGDDSSDDTGGTDQTEDSDTPGFGVVAALISLLAAALLATRRD